MRQKGFSIFQLLVTIAIVAFLIVSVYKYYQHVSESNKAADLIGQIRSINAAAAVYRQVDVSPNYIYKKLKSQEVMPRDWVPSDTSSRWITPRWGSFFIGGLGAGGYVANAPPGYGSLDGFLYTISSVDKNICLQVIQGIESEFDFIALNNSNRKILKNYDVPFSHSNVADECSKNGNTVWLGLMVYK